MGALDDSGCRRSIFFVGGFHLGIPLDACKTGHPGSWPEVRRQLEERFRQIPDRFEVLPPDFVPETKFPLGCPVVLRHRCFLESLNVFDALFGQGSTAWQNDYRFSNVFWLCPSGVVLIIAEIGCSDHAPLQLATLQDTIEKHYADLTHIFLELFQVVYGMLCPRALKSPLCSDRKIALCLKGVRIRDRIGQRMAADGASGHVMASSVLTPGELCLYEDILTDVYFIEFEESEDRPQNKPTYVFARIRSDDREFLCLSLISFSSFVSFLWLQSHLNEHAGSLLDGLGNAFPRNQHSSRELKLYRIFCMRLINESHPISIRLTREYVEFLEGFWQDSRMEMLENQIYKDLDVLDEMFLWKDEVARERKNLKIGIAAIFLALVSLTSVVAQLISTVDYAQQMGVAERVLLIYLGLVFGLLVTLVIYFIPLPPKS